MTASALAVAAMAACGTNTGSSDKPEQQSVLTLLANDLKGSLQKTMDTTDKATSVTMKMEGTVAGEKMTAQGVVDLSDPVKAEMTSTGPDGSPVTIRIIGSVFYVGVPESERAEMDGKSWLKMDMTEAAADAGVDFSQQFANMDPTTQVKTLLKTEGISVVGEETVNGVKTVHYTVTSPTATYLGQLDASVRDGVEQQLSKAGAKDVKLDLWVDEQYQPRRVKVLMGTVSDMTVDYLDYGKPVSIETPAAADTADLAEMFKGLTEGLTEGLPTGK